MLLEPIGEEPAPAPDSVRSLPDLIVGCCLCPPDDCGGAPGWQHLKAAMTRLAEDMAMLEWYYGWSRPPKSFSLDKWPKKAVRKALREKF